MSLPLPPGAASAPLHAHEISHPAFQSIYYRLLAWQRLGCWDLRGQLGTHLSVNVGRSLTASVSVGPGPSHHSAQCQPQGLPCSPFLGPSWGFSLCPSLGCCLSHQTTHHHPTTPRKLWSCRHCALCTLTSPSPCLASWLCRFVAMAEEGGKQPRVGRGSVPQPFL